VEDARLLSHPDLDARAAGQVRAVSWIGDEDTVYARLGEASPCSEATLMDPDELPADRRARLGDPEKSGRDYRRATDHPPVHPYDLLRLSKPWCHDRDTGRAPCRRRRRSGRGRAQEKKDASDRDGNAEPHEATLTVRFLREATQAMSRGRVRALPSATPLELSLLPHKRSDWIGVDPSSSDASADEGHPAPAVIVMPIG
jgi:hypothetical protein